MTPETVRKHTGVISLYMCIHENKGVDSDCGEYGDDTKYMVYVDHSSEFSDAIHEALRASEHVAAIEGVTGVYKLLDNPFQLYNIMEGILKEAPVPCCSCKKDIKEMVLIDSQGGEYRCEDCAEFKNGEPVGCNYMDAGDYNVCRFANKIGSVLPSAMAN